MFAWHTLTKRLATHHYKYDNTSTKQEIDQTPDPVLLARSSLATPMNSPAHQR